MTDVNKLRNRLWVEKYRPKTIDDVILPSKTKSLFETLRDKGAGEVPNLLLSGPPGTGKTTVAKALISDLDSDYLMINGSDSADAGIDSFRTRVKSFASSVSLEGTRKFVIIDEGDYLGPTVQPALRNMMEELSKNCTFIITCNHRNRIIEALQSRLSLVEFHIPSDEKSAIFKSFLNRVTNILDENGVEYEKRAVAEYTAKHFPDFRKVINELQKHSNTKGVVDSSILGDNKEDAIAELMEHMKKKNFTAVRKWCNDNIDLGSSTIFRQIYDSISKHVVANSIPQAILILADYQYKAYFVADLELNLVAALTELMAEMEWR